MPSLPEQIESRDSSHSLLSERRSEMGSRYLVESGVYMSSFATTIFIAAVMTIGVLMLTLLVALTVMLQSCQNSSSQIFELSKTSENVEYCNYLTMHAELNNLQADELPTICKQHALQDMKRGQYSQELNLAVQVAESYFHTLVPDGDGFDLVLVDLDDGLSPETVNNSNSYQNGKHIEDMNSLARHLITRLHLKLQARGWSVVPFTRMDVKEWNATIENLKSAGYGGWPSLIMRSDDEIAMESWEYISGRRVQLHGQGYRIASVISSKLDALTGPCLGKRNFKLPNPYYYNFDKHRIGKSILLSPRSDPLYRHA